jgi:ribosomal protein S18 acetylase RimI-like enzyme
MIRKATLDDLKILMILFEKYVIFYQFDYDYCRYESYLKSRIENHEAFVYIAFDENNRALGFVLNQITFSSLVADKILILNDLFVESSSQKNAVSEQLIAASKQFAKENQIRTIRLRTAKDNEVAQGLYPKMNFVGNGQFFTYNLSLN